MNGMSLAAVMTFYQEMSVDTTGPPTTGLFAASGSVKSAMTRQKKQLLISSVYKSYIKSQ